MFGGLAGLLASRKRVVDEQSEICDSVATGIGSLVSERRTHATQVCFLHALFCMLRVDVDAYRDSPTITLTHARAGPRTIFIRAILLIAVRQAWSGSPTKVCHIV